MRYIVEIDPSFPAGAELLKYIADLHAPADAVRIHKAASISDEEMALPGKKISTTQLEEWLALPDYGNLDGEAALLLLKEEMATYRTTKK